MLIHKPKNIKVIFDRRKEIDKGEKKGRIEITLTFGNSFYIATGIKIQSKEWNKQNIFGKWVKHSCENAESYNQMILDAIKKIQAIEKTCLENGEIFEKKHLSASNNAKDTGTNDFLSFCENHLEQTVNIAANTRKQLRKVIEDLKLIFKEITFKDVNYQLAKNYANELYKRGNGQNTVVKYLKKMKQFANEAYRCGHIPIDTLNSLKSYKLHEKDSNKDSLSLEDIEKLEKYKFAEDKKRLEIVRDYFLFAIYTGLRFTDIQTLKHSEIIELHGHRTVRKQMQKTSEVVEIPISKIVFQGKAGNLIEKYKKEGIESCFDVQTNQSTNRQLKEIADLVKLTIPSHKVTFHTARHTFACIALNNGINIETVQKLLGHTKIETTKIYAKKNYKGVIKEFEKL